MAGGGHLAAVCAPCICRVICKASRGPRDAVRHGERHGGRGGGEGGGSLLGSGPGGSLLTQTASTAQRREAQGTARGGGIHSHPLPSTSSA